MQQAAVLELIHRVIEHWGPESQHVIIGGNWNESLKDRIGYSSGSATAAAESLADPRLGAWSREMGLSVHSPFRARQAVLDAFLISSSV